MSLHRALMAVVLGLGVAVGGWAKGALSAGGALAASVVGAATFGFGGLPAGAALVAFFVSGSWLSRRAAVAGEVASAKGHRRDALQVVANGGVAALAAVASGLGFGLADGAVLGALAAAAADTWASEIGVRSPAPPRSIASGKPVSPGTSGGVTPLGWLAAGLGGLFVGLVYSATARGRFGWRQPILVALAAGLIGSLGDSIAGATVQAAYRCPACGALAESPRRHCRDAIQPATLVRGARWITNDAVNLIATSIGGLVGAVGWSGQAMLHSNACHPGGDDETECGGHADAEGLRNAEHVLRGARHPRARPRRQSLEWGPRDPAGRAAARDRRRRRRSDPSDGAGRR